MAVELDPQLLEILACPSPDHAPLRPGTPGRPGRRRADLHLVRPRVPGPRRHPGAAAGRGDPAGAPAGGAGRAGEPGAGRHPAGRPGAAGQRRRRGGRLPAGRRVGRCPGAGDRRSRRRVRHRATWPASAPGPWCWSTGPAWARPSTRLLAALLAPACPVPVVVAEDVPSWVGPLDVVLAHTDDPGDLALAASLHRAGRYGATVVLTAPEDGPVAAAAAAGTRAAAAAHRRCRPASASRGRWPPACPCWTRWACCAPTSTCWPTSWTGRPSRTARATSRSSTRPSRSRCGSPTARRCCAGLDRVATAVAEHAADVLAGFAGIVAGQLG